MFWHDSKLLPHLSPTLQGSKNPQRAVAIGKPERQVRKASHCGSKQQ